MESTTKVIIVEHNGSVGQMLKEYLSGQDLAVQLVTSAEEAVAYLLSNPEVPDLIISEVMNGSELCRFVRQRDLLKHIPFILLTQNNLAEKIASFEAGADDYLVKPVQPRELLVRVKVLLSLRPRLGQKMNYDRGQLGSAMLN